MKTTEKELSPMTIYKASAGSGKTFTLAAQYISIVMYEAWKYKNYKAFEHIVAMTFTVKATKEMKDRILSYLYDLGQGRNDSSFAGFKNKLSELLQLKDTTINILAPDAQDKLQTCAKSILDAILKNYARFNITTIDSFFQSVLQGVLYELGLPAEQQLILDETEIHNQSVDRMIDNLRDDEEGKAVLGPIIDFATDSLDDNKSVWDIRKELKNAAQKLGEEVYKFHAEAIENESKEGRYDQLRKALYAKKRQLITRIEQECDHFLQKADAHPLADKRPVSTLITSAKNMRAQKRTEPTQAVQKVLNGETTGDSIYDDFITLYNNYDRYMLLINTIVTILPNLYTITLLANIESNMKDIQKENMQMLLSNANLFLRDLLEGDARSFVYSKVGPKLEHLLIDEFQDTSQMQWNNLQPLVEELYSAGRQCIIVGDIKQSIYRFRNGKWKLLADLANRHDFVTLGDNFRSTRAVVETNNALFPLLAQEMDSILADNEYGSAYLSPVYEKDKEVHQNAHKEGGNVRFYLYPKATREAKTETEEALQRDFCERIKDIRQHIKAQNGSDSIAILVRTGKEGAIVLNWMQEDEDLRQVPVETEKSYQLGSSTAVQVVVAMLKYLAEKDKNVRLCSIEKQYLSDILGEHAANELEEQRDEWLRHPLYEMNDRLIKHFGLTQLSEDEFIEKYLSCLKAYLTADINTSSDLSRFIEYWDNTLNEVTVNKTPEKDSVTLMTIHKSKGLAFDYVLVPLLNSTMNKETKTTTLLWETAAMADDGNGGVHQETQAVSVLSVSSTRSKTGQSLWSEPYREEVKLRFMDAINSVYVAFTRAKQAYYCWCAYSKKPTTTDTDSIGTPLLKALEKIENLQKEEMDGESVIFTCDYPAPETSRTGSRDTYMERLDITQNAKQHPIEAPMFPDTDTLPIEIVNSNRALQLFRDIQTDTQSLQEQKTFIENGLIYHALFEHLTSLTADDVQKSVNTYRLTHELDALHEKTFRRFVEAAQSHHILREAFSPDAQTLTEAAFIVTTDNGVETLRPDRVALLDDRAIVIDYKFSSYKHLLLNDSKHVQQRQDYYRQLQQYVTMIERFYHVPAEGWFWFLRDNEVINVNNLNN